MRTIYIYLSSEYSNDFSGNLILTVRVGAVVVIDYSILPWLMTILMLVIWREETGNQKKNTARSFLFWRGSRSLRSSRAIGRLRCIH